MSKTEAKKKLQEAQAIVFEVEKALSSDCDNYIRKQGYRTRIAIGDFDNLIRSNCDDTDISIQQ